jgi:uncharacterized protein (TIGR04255 family)
MIDVATKPGQPPVIETVLGVHFHPIQGLTAAHFGIFWKTVLRPDWTRAVEAPPIVEQTERFSDMPSWLNISPGSVIAVPLSAHSSSRLQISNSTGDRMVQLQSNRFHYNWKRTEGPYPSYFAVREEFSQQFRHFRQFVEEQGLGQVKPFQWEVTYVDYIPPGVLWQSPEDWHKVIPGLLGGRHQDTLRLESVTGDWRYEITPKRGRVYINLGLGKPDEKEMPGILLQWTARGPITGESEGALSQGLDLAHDVLLKKFLDVTSPEAHRAWGLKE